jgi:hypothetical protein
MCVYVFHFVKGNIMLQVTVPPNAVSGQMLDVAHNGSIFRVTIPEGAKPGQTMTILVPSVVAPVVVVAASTTQSIDSSSIYGMEISFLNGLAFFLPAAPKANKRQNNGGRVPNANPHREGYVFGGGTQGDGYYRLDSVDADKIIVTRLQAKLNPLQITETARIARIDRLKQQIAALERQVEIGGCCTRTFANCSLSGARSDLARHTKLQNECENIRALVNDPSLRRSSKPGELNKKRSSERNDNDVGGCGGAACGAFFYAGCGGGGGEACGACGAAGCGAAGCGGGGGGGGCGGGGCGGGGCGGG